MENHKIFQMAFSNIYPMYVEKAQKKGRTKDEVNRIIQWLTGYSNAQLLMQIEKNVSFETFFKQAPALNESRYLITGTICGVKIETIEHPLMKNIRYLDKLIDELAKGKPMEKILRS